MYPYYLKEQGVFVPCGKCPECLKRRASGWAFRLEQQQKISDNALFITLTYDTDNVPIISSGYMNLVKSDLQKFFKRLRKYLTTKKIDVSLKYYACGEYGTKSWRPHYHIILFNFPHCQDYNEVITPIWGFGSIDVGTVTPQSIAYVLKYMSKPKRVPLHLNDNRQPEFSLMSKGLGANYLTPNIIKYHNADMTRVYLTKADGVKMAMPRYYKDKLYTDEQKELLAKYFHDLAFEQETKRQNSYWEEHGSLDNYQKDKYSRLMAARNNYFNRTNKDRNKL